MWTAILTLVLCFPQFADQGVVVICESQDLAHAIEPVRKDVARRFPNAVVLLVHGEPFGNIWVSTSDYIQGGVKAANYKARVLREQYPDRPIVFWSCNATGLKLKGKNVWYFKKKVWSIPDSQLPHRMAVVVYDKEKRLAEVRHSIYSREDNNMEVGDAGDIFEAVEGEHELSIAGK